MAGSKSGLPARSLPASIESVDDVMAEIYKRIKPLERLEIGLDLWISSMQMLTEAVRSFHPEWTKLQVEREAARRMSRESP